MAMVVNDIGSSGETQMTPEQIAARAAARQAEIERYQSLINKLNADIKKLEIKKEEFNKMIGDLGTALGYLEQAKEETKEIIAVLAGSYNGNNARTYVSQIDNAEGDIALNISKINTVSGETNTRVKEIEQQIQEKKVQINRYKGFLSRI